MIQKYQIEIYELDSSVKAVLFINNNGKWESLGSVYRPANITKTKEEFAMLFEAIGNTIYGQEKKAQKLEESDNKFFKAISDNKKKTIPKEIEY